jgi:hypothetical protein
MKTLLSMCFLLAAFGVGSTAHAQSDADRATARALAREAEDAFKKNDFGRAADLYGRADALVHAPTLLLGLGRAQAGLGKLVAAQETFARIVREGVAPGAPPAFAKALETAKEELEALAPRIPTVIIQVTGAPSATVTLDGAPVPSASLGVKRPVDPGKHVVQAKADGYAPAEATFTIAERKSETVTLELKRTGGVAPVPVVAPPPASTPPPAEPAPAKPPEPADQPAAPSSTRKILGWVALGVGAGGIGMGAVTGGLALGKHGKLADACTDGRCSPDQAGVITNYHTLSTLSTVGFIAGGALAAGGVILILTAPKAPAKTSFAPVLGPGYGGVSGRF